MTINYSLGEIIRIVCKISRIKYCNRTRRTKDDALTTRGGKITTYVKAGENSVLAGFYFTNTDWLRIFSWDIEEIYTMKDYDPTPPFLALLILIALVAMLMSLVAHFFVPSTVATVTFILSASIAILLIRSRNRPSASERRRSRLVDLDLHWVLSRGHLPPRRNGGVHF